MNMLNSFTATAKAHANAHANAYATANVKPNSRLVDLIFEAVQMKIELTRSQIRDTERNLERLTSRYGCEIDDLAELIRCGRVPISREDALTWCGELVRLKHLREDYAHLSLLS